MPATVQTLELAGSSFVLDLVPTSLVDARPLTRLSSSLFVRTVLRSAAQHVRGLFFPFALTIFVRQLSMDATHLPRQLKLTPTPSSSLFARTGTDFRKSRRSGSLDRRPRSLLHHQLNKSATPSVGSVSCPSHPPSCSSTRDQLLAFFPLLPVRHPCFIRGQTHLLQQIKRKAVKSADKKPVPSPRASSSSLGPARHDDVHHPHEIYHHHPPTSRKRHSEGDGESMDDLISAAEGASDRLPAPAVPSHSSSSGPHHQHPSHESGQHRISDPWNPPAAALSPTLAAMTDRITALEEGLYHSRMDALQSQRDLARSVLAVMDRHDGDESNEDRKEDSEFSSAFVRRSSETDSISTCSFLSAFSSSSTRGST